MWLLITIINYLVIIETYKIPIPRVKRNVEQLLGNHSKQPNIILITSSELGWDDISQHGSPLALTPNLHTLSRHGIHFSHHYISPWDFSTKVELFTGEYASHLGYQHGNVTNEQPVGLNKNIKILPEYLKDLGYITKVVGKWGLGFFDKKMTPTYRGFDYFKGSLGFDNIDYYNYTSRSTTYEGYDLRLNENIFYPKLKTHYTELITDNACDIILNHTKNNDPLFLYISYQSPQVATTTSGRPQPPKKWIKPFEGLFNDTERIEHSAMVLSLDVAIGKIMDALTEANIFDNTFILFISTSTSQSCSTYHGVGCNYPLRGGKGTYWEGGIRSMALVYSNTIKNPGKTIKDNIHITDWLPTLLKIASTTNNESLSKYKNIHGFDLKNVISNGDKSKREFILHGFDQLTNNSGAIRVRDYKLIINQQIDQNSDWTKYFKYDRNKINDLIMPGFRPISHSNSDINSVILCDNGFPHPYLRLRAPPCVPTNRPCLFNTLWDPCEYHNLAEFMPKTTNYLYNNTKAIIDSGYIKKPIFPDNDPQSNPKNYNNVWTPWRNSYETTNDLNIDNIAKFLDEDNIIVIKNKTIPTISNHSDNSLKSPTTSVGITREYNPDQIDLNMVPYHLINEDEIDNFGKNDTTTFLDDNNGNKILKISCEELDYYNYTIECINLESAQPNITQINPINVTNMYKKKADSKSRNISPNIVVDVGYEKYKNDTIMRNDLNTTNQAISNSNDQFKLQRDNIIQNGDLKNVTSINNDNILNNEDLSVIPLKNKTQLMDKNLSVNIPVSVERFNFEAKPERAIDGNETTNKPINIGEMPTYATPNIQNISHNIVKENNKNESDFNDSIKKNLESLFKVAKSEGSTKVTGPYDNKNSSLQLITNATAGNDNDEKIKKFPNFTTENETNPNINWHLTSKAKSVDYNPDMTTLNNLTRTSFPNWSNFTTFDNMTHNFSEFTNFKSDPRNNVVNGDTIINSNVSADANANKGESLNINALSLNSDKEKPHPIGPDTIAKPNFEPVKNITFNANNSSQKSLIKDGDSFRPLEVINESINQNQTQWKDDCDCGGVSDTGALCDKCIGKFSSGGATASSPYDPSKIIHSQNLGGVNSLQNHKIDGIPFTGQIEMSNKKFNVEGTALELSLGKSTSESDYSISSNNDNIIGMSLLKNSGYDPKEGNRSPELEIMESSANIKLAPNPEKLVTKKKGQMIKTKKNMIESVGDLGDYNEDTTTSTLFKNPQTNQTLNNVISKLEQIFANNTNIRNHETYRIDNITQLYDTVNKSNNPLKDIYNNFENSHTSINTSVPNNASIINSSSIQNPGQKKDLVDPDEFSPLKNTDKDYSQVSGTKTSQIATIITIVLAGMIIIGMGIVAVVTIVSKNIFDTRSRSSSPKQSKPRHKRTSRSNKLKEKIPFNA